MALVGELEFGISVKTGDIGSELDKAEKKVKDAAGKLSAWTIAKGQLIADFVKKGVESVGKIATDTVKQAFQNFADYEQLVGGVDTLFKDSSKKVQQYASQAYMTAGVSANKYMEAVTSFSASLLQSLGGDTDKAADIANMAMIDMSDNVNKMGSSMESVESAYRGFSKQNYTMLDNLKLGYGGTRKEMERLLKDAGKLTGKKYDIKNLSDVYEAIHAIQQEMGIAGTTQKEAMETVAGSMNAAKAAWQDVLTAIGSGKNIKQSIKNFAKTAKVALKNAAPVVKDAVVGLFSAAKEIAPELGNIINEVGRDLFGKKWDITINWIQNAWNTVSSAFTTASEWVGNAYKVTVKWIQNAWKTVSSAFTAASEWVGNAYNVTVKWIQNAWRTVSSAFTKAAEWVGNAYNVTVKWIQNAWRTVNSAFTKAGEWVGNAYNVTVKWLQETWNTVSSAFTTAAKWAGKAFDTTINFVRGLWDDVSSAISKVAVDTYNSIVNFRLGIVDAVNSFIDKLKHGVDVVVNFFTGNTPKAPNTSDFGASNVGTDNFAPMGGSGGINMPMKQAKGNWYVPYDNYPALLHRGEMVLNKSQARQMRDGEGGMDIGGIVASAVNQAISRVNVMMSGEKVGDLTTKRVKRNINANSYSRQRALGG